MIDWQVELEQQAGLADDEIDVAGTALALAAADHPETPLAPLRAHLAELATRLPASRPSAAALAARLAREHGYAGDAETYEDTRNADLIEVIGRRRGLPVALGVLYMHVARAQGWSITGLNFPGHFVLRLKLDDGFAILDPFHSGRTVSLTDLKALLRAAAGQAAELRPAHMAAVSARQVLIRLQNNIRIRAEQAGDSERAIEILRRTSLFAPREVSVWMQWADIEVRRHNLRRAIAVLDEASEAVEPGGPSEAIKAARTQLQRRLN